MLNKSKGAEETPSIRQRLQATAIWWAIIAVQVKRKYEVSFNKMNSPKLGPIISPLLYGNIEKALNVILRLPGLFIIDSFCKNLLSERSIKVYNWNVFVSNFGMCYKVATCSFLSNQSYYFFSLSQWIFIVAPAFGSLETLLSAFFMLYFAPDITVPFLRLVIFWQLSGVVLFSNQAIHEQRHSSRLYCKSI